MKNFIEIRAGPAEALFLYQNLIKRNGKLK